MIPYIITILYLVTVSLVAQMEYTHHCHDLLENQPAEFLQVNAQEFIRQESHQ